MIKIESCWKELEPSMSQIWGIKTKKKIMVVVDENVAKLHLDDVRRQLLGGTAWDIFIFHTPVDESIKTMSMLSELLCTFANYGLDRGSVVIALGGGTVGDVAGFAASIYMRGIEWAVLPTTLLAAADSAIGGKTGIDLCSVKNLVGTFHQPRLIYTNLSTLITLPEADYISGLAEVIKYGIIYDKDLLDYLYGHRQAVFARDVAAMQHIVGCAAAIKAEIVALDKCDKGMRQILNFGHTVGHAIEAAMGVSHGHAVAIGMVRELEYSVRHHGLCAEQADFAFNLIKAYGLPIKGDIIPPLRDVLDKKVVDGRLSLPVIPALGRTIIIKEVDLCEFLKSTCYQ